MIVLEKFNRYCKDIILEQKENGCIECISHSKDDCGYTRVRYNGKHDRLFRVVYKMKYGEIPKRKVIRHTCDNPACCNIDHLVIGTKADNVKDMIERGRSTYHKPNLKCRGEKNAHSKLTEKQVKEIYLSKDGCGKLSKLYNVSKTNILLIKKKKGWTWLTDELDKQYAKVV